MCAHLKAPKAISELFSFLGVSRLSALSPAARLLTFKPLNRLLANIRRLFSAASFLRSPFPRRNPISLPSGRSPRLFLRSPFPRRNPILFRRNVRRARRVFFCVRRSPVGTRFRFDGTFAAPAEFALVPPPDKKRRDGSFSRRGVFSLPILRGLLSFPSTRPSG